MKRRWLGVSTSLLLWLAAVGCGESTSSQGPSAGSGGQAASAGNAAAGSSLASGGSASGTSHAGAGSPSAGSGSGSGGSTASGGSVASGAAGAPDSVEGGAGGAAGDLVLCDPKRVLCKLLPGECPEMQVRAVEGTCWGECVDIAQCACSAADDCPDNGQYTCWAKSHCGPYVR